jgi:hypothetical protein
MPTNAESAIPLFQVNTLQMKTVTATTHERNFKLLNWLR